MVFPEVVAAHLAKPSCDCGTGFVKALFQEYDARRVDFAQRLVREAWGGLDFHVRDPDGNVVSFVQYRWPTSQAEEARQ